MKKYTLNITIDDERGEIDQYSWYRILTRFARAKTATREENKILAQVSKCTIFIYVELLTEIRELSRLCVFTRCAVCIVYVNVNCYLLRLAEGASYTLLQLMCTNICTDQFLPILFLPLFSLFRSVSEVSKITIVTMLVNILTIHFCFFANYNLQDNFFFEFIIYYYFLHHYYVILYKSYYYSFFVTGYVIKFLVTWMHWPLIVI